MTSAEPSTRVSTAQFSGPFAEEFRAFAAADSAAPPPAHPILFYGSSSIRLWQGLSAGFPGLPVLNRGFGGSTLWDCVYHFFTLVKPYAPARVIFYAGDNDLDQGTPPEEVRNRYAEFLRRIRKHCGEIPVTFISIKPSPARWGNVQAIRRTNALIADLIEAERAAHPETWYLDFAPAMVLADGAPDRSLYEPDQLHLNARGYALWTRLLLASGRLDPAD
jgi:lysophospholipase L1-like esterase